MKTTQVSVIIPHYNEKGAILELVQQLEKILSKTAYPFEIIVVDDHSTDGSSKILQRLAKEKRIIFHEKSGKKGKSFSLSEGFSMSCGEVLVMIDGDLQYDPNAIPGMLEGIENGADIVVANRKSYADERLRRFLSKTFRTIFGNVVFGLPYDIQSGLKVFRKEVLDTIVYAPSTSWTFDLGFLKHAQQAGFCIRSYDIVFHKRKEGNSKVSILKQSFEIGSNALALRIKQIAPIRIAAKEAGSMQDAGVRYKKKKYVTHTTLHHNFSALVTLTRKQKVLAYFFFVALFTGLLLYPLETIQSAIAVLSIIYFVDVVFNLCLILKSLHQPQEISFSEKELDDLDDADLPIYSILCPLYREAHVLPQFLYSISLLDYPKEKLDVLLLLEEDDVETTAFVKDMKLPAYIRPIIVPHSMPKTKPKACNYGLNFVKGEYLVIYDAEDIPDPLQLKKAIAGFKKSKDDIICLQAKLNYYNLHQNLLTRFFTAEYSLWFDITLTGLQSLSTSIPLGGTSNHFKTESLKQMEGWDPFNVTEDADLGVRLFKHGYKTAIIDSTTLEEANSKWKNWLRQRSRWIKGYMQTFLVHNREIPSFVKESGIHAFIFQLTIGGKIAFILINPLLWTLTISYFALYAYVGPAIESLYPTWVFYIAVFSLVFGNFLFLYYYMIGCIKRKQWSLVKYVFLVPFYWLMISLAGAVALYQLIFKPHYWEKTLHGLHLKEKAREYIQEAVIETEEAEAGRFFGKEFRNRLRLLITVKNGLFGGGALVIALNIGNVLNFLFNAYLGRVLDFDDFALISLFGSFFSFVTLLTSPLSATVNYRSAFLIGRSGERSGYAFWQYVRKYALSIGVFAALIWIILSPFLISFFKAESIYLFLVFSTVLVIGFISAVDRGFLSARLLFGSMAVVTLLEPIVKLLSAFVIVRIDAHLAYISIPLSAIGTFLLGWFLVRRGKNRHVRIAQKEKKFPKSFFLVSFISGLSTVAFLSMDVVLAKHYLSPDDAGKYALLSLVGKMVYFLGGLVSPFILPLVSRNEGARKSSSYTLFITVITTFLLTLAGCIAFGVLGKYSLPILYGKKASSIIPYVAIFSYAMMTFTISKVFVTYYQAKKIYTFPIVSSFLGLFQIVLIAIHHENIGSIVTAMEIAGVLNISIMIVLHSLARYVAVIESNFVDFLGLFARHPVKERKTGENLSILILNWRDTKHKFAGGAEVYIHELAKNWVKKNHKVTVFCGSDSKNPRYEMVDGVEIIRRGGFYFVYIWAFLYYGLRLRGKYDVIIDCENGLPFFTPLYAAEKKFLLIHHVHQEVFRQSLRWPFHQIASFMERRLIPLVYRNVQVITVSPSSKKEIMEHKLTKIEPIVIYNGVDLGKFKPGVKNHKPLILYLGRLKYYKSLHVFIKAAEKVLQSIKDVEFVIAGNGEEEKGLKKLAQRLGIERKILFLGKVSEEEKIALYQKAWVFVNPSLMEGWGITTIEANACGTPVVASNVAGLRDSIKNPHTGYLVQYGNADEFARRIEELLTDNQLRNEFSKNAIAWASEFDWDRTAEDFLSLITASLVEGAVTV